jgi:hypothetical protein
LLPLLLAFRASAGSFMSGFITCSPVLPRAGLGGSTVGIGASLIAGRVRACGVPAGLVAPPAAAPPVERLSSTGGLPETPPGPM